VPTWIIDSPSMPLGWKPEYHADGYSKQLEYLWISYEFGLDSMFHRVWYVVTTVVLCSSYHSESPIFTK
jgi:hypothetical protein